MPWCIDLLPLSRWAIFMFANPPHSSTFIIIHPKFSEFQDPKPTIRDICWPSLSLLDQLGNTAWQVITTWWLWITTTAPRWHQHWWRQKQATMVVKHGGWCHQSILSWIFGDFDPFNYIITYHNESQPMPKADQWIQRTIQINKQPKRAPFLSRWITNVLKGFSKSKISIDSGHSCARTNCQPFRPWWPSDKYYSPAINAAPIQPQSKVLDNPCLPKPGTLTTLDTHS